ncbi:MAG: hypothetical protein P4L57_01460 [Rhizomicrobium sp.]|nr:hypothetical protein [Rhizomicrobium sp.]
MRAPVQREFASATGLGRRLGLGAALIGLPATLCLLFAQIDWFWVALGWAGMAMVALVAVMAVMVIAALSRPAATSQIRRLQETVAKLSQAAAIPQALAEAMWCEQQRELLLDKSEALAAAPWEQTMRAFQDDTAAYDGSLDHWTPEAEALARWAQLHLPTHYTVDDVEKPAPQTAPGEAAMAELRRMEYRSLYWRKQMMERYVDAIAAKLETRAQSLRQTITAAGNPLG